MPEIPLRAQRAGKPLYKSCQMQLLHETSAQNDGGDKRGDTTETKGGMDKGKKGKGCRATSKKKTE